jgi:hypothetical protein
MFGTTEVPSHACGNMTRELGGTYTVQIVDVFQDGMKQAFFHNQIDVAGTNFVIRVARGGAGRDDYGS